METIDDIRREEDNPRSRPVAGPPQSIFSFFHGSSARLVSALLMAVGIIILVIGAMLFVAPLMITGVVILAFSALAFIWNKPASRESAL